MLEPMIRALLLAAMLAAAPLAASAQTGPVQPGSPPPGPAQQNPAQPGQPPAGPQKEEDRPPDAPGPAPGPAAPAAPAQTTAPRNDPRPPAARAEAPPVELGGLLTIGAARDLLEGFGMKVLAENRFGTAGTVPGFQTIGANGVPFWLQLLNCAGEGEAATCPHAQVISCWSAEDLPARRLPDIATVNGFNARYVFGRAWLVDQPGQLCVNFGIFADGGITRTALRRSMSYWLTVSDEFRRHFGL